MRRKAVIVDWHKPKLRLYAIGDTHIGSAACDEKRIAKLAQIIAEDDNALAVGLGDYIEAIAPSDWRWEPMQVAPFIGPENVNNIFYCQAAYFAEVFKATKGKWAMMVPGNHETVAARRYHTDAGALIAGWLGTAYQGQEDEAGWLKVRFFSGKGKSEKNRGSLDVYCQHGWGGGELRGGDALKLERLCYRKQAAVVLLAHVHRAHAFPITVEGVDNAGWEQPETRWGVISYAMIEKHGYIAKRGGNAPPIGYAVIEVERSTHEALRVSVELRQL